MELGVEDGRRARQITAQEYLLHMMGISEGQKPGLFKNKKKCVFKREILKSKKFHLMDKPRIPQPIT